MDFSYREYNELNDTSLEVSGEGSPGGGISEEQIHVGTLHKAPFLLVKQPLWS